MNTHLAHQTTFSPLQARLNGEVLDLNVGPGEMVVFEKGLQGRQLLAVDGALWITLSGDTEDHVLRTGQRYQVSSSSKLVVEGLPAGRVQVAA